MSDPGQKSPRRRRLVVAVLVIACLAVLAFWLFGRRAPTPAAEFPLPPYTASPYLNTLADAKYVGLKTCAQCHPENHGSYLLTAHSRAFANLDPIAEPPDGAFYHEASGRHYRVYRQDGNFRHEEVLRDKGGKEVARTDWPIRYLIGSGNFTRSYVVEVDGFLHESPITWYTARKRWDMSPGFNKADHLGFERAIDVGCLSCHVGQVERIDNSFHRLKIGEQAIGCESCHGPGSLHTAFHRAKKRVAGPDDLTIVNPGKLPRTQLEAICAQCHLRGDATIYLRGRDLMDFRPGRPLSDYRIDYHYAGGTADMKVVGHSEQMKLSQCYQQSKNLTCLTCHDPHASEKPKEPLTIYRQKCLMCHTEQSCGLEKPKRLMLNATDNCTACHMPRGDTDIPHIAFTHHRIGIHNKQSPQRPYGLPELAPMADVSHLSEIDQQRNLGLAYLEVAFKQAHPEARGAYRMRALELLQGVHKAGLDDAETQEALARIHWEEESNKAAAFAKSAVNKSDLAARYRVNALFIIADHHFHTRQGKSAVTELKKLVRLRRHSEDWKLLGLSLQKSHRPQEATSALEKACSINPFRADIHFELAKAYRQNGHAKRATEHQTKAEFLIRHSRRGN